MKIAIVFIFFFSIVSCYIRPLHDKRDSVYYFPPFSFKPSFNVVCENVTYSPHYGEFKIYDVFQATTFTMVKNILYFSLSMLWTVITVMIPAFFYFPFK